VFEPFVPAKPGIKNQGLGLAAVQGFAAQCGGTVAATSRSGQGTSITLILPGTKE
jgi:signal transduction histidine kinase